MYVNGFFVKFLESLSGKIFDQKENNLLGRSESLYSKKGKYLKQALTPLSLINGSPNERLLFLLIFRILCDDLTLVV